MSNKEIKNSVVESIITGKEMNSFAEDIMNGKEPELDLGIQNEPIDLELEAEEVEEVPDEIPAEDEPELELGLQESPVEEMENPLEEVFEKPEEVKKFKVSRQDICVKTYLNRFKSGEIKIPECQRMFVWDDKQIDELLVSIKKGLSMTELKLGEVDGQMYLADGLQRTTALMKMLDSKKISDEDKKTIQSYKVLVNTTHDMDWDSFNEYFYNCNNGTALASAVKACAKLSDKMHAAVMELSGNEFFRTATAKKVFSKNDQKRVIAMAFLSYSAGIKAGITAPVLSKRLIEAEDIILNHKDEAKRRLDIVVEGLSQLEDKFVYQATNANYICAWNHVFDAYTNVGADDVAEVTMKIFEGAKPLPAYSRTVGGGSSSKNSVENRAKVYMKVMEEVRKNHELEWNSEVV